MDANETFCTRWGTSIISDSGRGELMLESLEALRFPDQDISSPSYFPYNQSMHPRRLDYICTRHLLSEAGAVLSFRDLGRSDHEPILVPILASIPKPLQSTPKTWGTRRLRGPTIVAETIANFRPGNSDPIALVAEIARQITIPGKQIDVFRESKEIKQFRRRVLEMEPGTDRKHLWKQLAKQRRDEHRAWQNQKLAQAGKKHWQDKQAVDNEKHSQAWELRLRSDDRWRETLTKHFGGIFHKSDSAVVDLHFAVILHRMAGQCKLVRWRPFTEEDLKAVRKRWKNGKHVGPTASHMRR